MMKQRLTWQYEDLYGIELDVYKKQKKMKGGKKYYEQHVNNIFTFDTESSNGFRLQNGKAIAYSHKTFEKFMKKAYRMSLRGIDIGEKPPQYKVPASLVYIHQSACEYNKDEILTLMGRTWSDFDKLLYTIDDIALNYTIFGNTDCFSDCESMDLRNKLMEDYKGKKSKLIFHFYIHNLSWDFQHMRNSQFRFKKVFAREMRKPMRAEIEMEWCKIIFHDTLALTQKSLRSWCEDAKLPVVKEEKIDYLKIYTPLSVLPERVIKYCEADVVSMVYGMRQYREKYNNKLDEIPMTQTGEVRIKCREHVSRVNKWYAEECYRTDHSYSFDEYSRLVDIFAGGWTHANMKYSNKLLKNIYCYDFASSYPSVMCTARFPRGEFWEIDEDRINEIEKTPIDKRKSCYYIVVDVYNFHCQMWNTFWSSSKVCFETIEVKGKKRKQPLSKNLHLDNGKIVSGEWARIKMTDLDWDIFRDVYDIESYNILEAYEAHSDYFPEELILTILEYFEAKTALKGTDRYSEYCTAKEFINSIYGCFVMKVIVDSIIYNNLGWGKKELSQSQFEKELTLPDDDILMEKEILKSFSTYQAGVWVTAWARHRLWDMIRSYDSNGIRIDEYVVYGDTDSLKGLFESCSEKFDEYNDYIQELQKQVADHYGFDVNKFKSKTADGKWKVLGVWEREADAIEFKTIGAKRYVSKHYNKKGELEIETTIAGLPKSAGSCHIKEVDDLVNNIYWTPRESGKLMSHYLDDMEETIWRDSDGVEYISNDKFGVMLEPVGFDLSLATDYDSLVNLLTGVGHFDYFDVTYVLR